MSRLNERRQEDRDRRRTQIVTAAEALYLHQDWDLITMDAVARQARLSRALVYVYFRDKAELHLAVVRRAMQTLLDCFREATHVGDTGLQRIEALGRAYLAYGQQYPHYFDACARFEARVSQEEPSGEHEQAVLQVGDLVHLEVVAVLAAGQADGTIRSDLGDLKVTSRALWGFIHGLSQIALTKVCQLEQAGITAAQLTEQAISLLRYMLATPATPAEPKPRN